MADVTNKQFHCMCNSCVVVVSTITAIIVLLVNVVPLLLDEEWRASVVEIVSLVWNKATEARNNSKCTD